jgi:hypothetical protein
MGALNNIPRLGPFAAAVAALAVGATSARAQCRGADSTATRMVAKYTNLLDRATVDGPTRQQLTKMSLPQPPAAVALVTNNTVCRKAEQAYTTALGANRNTPSGAVYVVKVGTSYVVRDPAQRGGDWTIEMVLDSQYRIKYKFGT